MSARARWLSFALLLAPTAGAQEPEASSAARAVLVPEIRLRLEFPPEFHAEPFDGEVGRQIVAAWSARCGSSSMRIDVRVLPEDFELREPLDVSELLVENERKLAPAFAFDDQRVLDGPYGASPHAIWARSFQREPGTTRTSGTLHFLCAVTDTQGYVIELTLQPAPDARAMALLERFVANGIVWQGEPRDPRWTQAELEARWRAAVPDERTPLHRVLRTEHYVILSSASGGKLFAEKMEACYAAIRAVYPFEELPGERLMPVFLFRTPDEYHAFFTRQFAVPVEEARRSKGVASRDFYATWYEAPNDPVHVHEATHQIFVNRLRLRGGGSWFQEGVAEYMSTSANERNLAASAVRKERHVPLAELIQVKSLLFSAERDSKRGEDEASDQYEQAAFLIEFLRERHGERFLDWVRAVGSVPRNDARRISRACRATLGMDLPELDAAWIAYAKDRRDPSR